jgi:hypothetical protein
MYIVIVIILIAAIDVRNVRRNYNIHVLQQS